MATFAQRPATLGRSLADVRVHPVVGVVALVALSLVLRTLQIDVRFWIDEGLSVGLASHPLTEIPGLLHQDGSPPLYYLLLHVWMGVFGRSEIGTHVLSLLFATATIPVAWWAGTSLFGRRVGWTLAAFAAFDPFLTQYAQETRMYSLVVLLGTATTAFFLHAHLRGRRTYRVPFGLALAAMLYTHGWTLFFATGLVAALVAILRVSADRGALLRDAAVGFGLAALLYLPWLPTLLFQARHTGAPWANQPSVDALMHAPDLLLGGQTGTVIVLLAGGAGLATLAADPDRDRRLLVPVLASLALVPIVVAWLASQASPAWAPRYLAVAVAPLLVLGAVGLTRGGRLGAVGLALLAVGWATTPAPAAKSNVHAVATTVAGELRPGDLVVSTAPEEVPVLRLYLPDGLRWASPFGLVPDTGVVDWRDGAAHFDRSPLRRTLLPLLDGLRPGQRVLLVNPILERGSAFRAPWTSRVRDRALEYEGILRADPRFRLADVVPGHLRLAGPNPVQGLLFVKSRGG